MGFDQQHLNWLITFLFNTSPDSIEQQDYHLAHYYLDKLDIAENYQLFSMVIARLPQRAKLFFLEESYKGKQQMIREVVDVRCPF
ncbi:hypothetical protein [uncultured Acinetobacter sp.]|uniref:hypothetical protein n=1 Tax=uncultured Acinetobacter sp. TaxID=165433 RepID=UPI00374A7230